MPVRLIAGALILLSAILALACDNDAMSEFEANAHRSSGYEANERGDWSVALEDYTRAIELDATAGDYTERGYAHSNLGDPIAAIADFTAAIELDPQSALAYSQRALEYNGLGRWADAIEDLDRAIELRPNRADQYNGRAFAHLNLGNWDQVVFDTSKALDLAEDIDPIVPVYLANRAAAYAELGEHELALADLEHSVRLDPDNLLSQQSWMALLVETGAVDEARAAAEALAADLGWPPVAVSLLMADLFRAAESFEAALVELDEAIALDPGSALLRLARATTHEDLGDLDAACVDYLNARDLASDAATRTEVANALGRLERAGSCVTRT